MNKLLFFSFLFLGTLSLPAQKSWEDWASDKAINTTKDFYASLNNYCDNSYTIDERIKFKKEVEELKWQQALSLNTLQSYNNYIGKYAKGKYIHLAKENIKNIQVSQNKVESVKPETFIVERDKLNSNSKKSLSIKTEKIDDNKKEKKKSYNNRNNKNVSSKNNHNNETEISAYQKTLKSNNIQQHIDFIKKYPDSKFTDSINFKLKKLIRLETYKEFTRWTIFTI